MKGASKLILIYTTALARSFSFVWVLVFSRKLRSRFKVQTDLVIDLTRVTKLHKLDFLIQATLYVHIYREKNKYIYRPPGYSRSVLEIRPKKKSGQVAAPLS